jgi:hypothetical protein
VDALLPKKLELPGFPYVLRLDDECLVAILERADPSGLPPPEVEASELIAAIERVGVLDVDAEGLERTLAQVRMGKRFCVARGLSPENGQDGHIQYHFEPRIAEKVWQEDESLKVNFRERNEINNVYEGDVLAELVPPSAALDGRNVLGHPIRAQRGKAARLLAGKNVVLSADGSRAFSKINGAAKEVGNRISVDAVQTIQGDLDFKSGNVDFAGDVVVFGTEKETFKIEAGGKTVEYAFNFARNPSIDGLRVICSPPGTEFDKQQLAEGFGYSGKNPWKENHERILRLIGSFFEEGSTNRVLRRKDR